MKVDLPLSFFTAHNGSRSCSYDSISLHSKYNPEHEAAQFAESVHFLFSPAAILVTGPALSYCAAPLRSRFPAATLCAIQYCSGFESYNSKWDHVFLLTPNDADGALLSQELFTCFDEETMCMCASISWIPSAHAFPDQDRIVWNAIKAASEKARSVLFTRSFFARRWISNTIKFCLFTNNVVSVIPGTSPVVVAASGQSLAGSLGQLKIYRKKFFLIAVSSALSVLLAHEIIPDLCITTDGGWWASLHIHFPGFRPTFPFAVPPEAQFPSCFRSSATVLPLSYDDGVSSLLLNQCGYSALHAERNGTVSGTAAMLGLSLTTGPVFMCGLDLAPAAGFQHAQPNCLELRNFYSESRLATRESRETVSRFSSADSLAIYRAWFSALPASFSSRLFRLSDHFKYCSELKTIGTVDFTSISSYNTDKCFLPRIGAPRSPASQNDCSAAVKKYFSTHSADSEMIHEIFPAEYVSWKRSMNDQERSERRTVLESRFNALITHIRRFL